MLSSCTRNIYIKEKQKERKKRRKPRRTMRRIERKGFPLLFTDSGYLIGKKSFVLIQFLFYFLIGVRVQSIFKKQSISFAKSKLFRFIVTKNRKHYYIFADK